MNKPNILFVVSEVAHYSEFKKLLLDERISSALNGILLFDRDGYDPNQLLAHEISDAKKNRFNYLVTNFDFSKQKTSFFTKIISRLIYIFEVTQFKKLPLLADIFAKLLRFLLQTINNVAFFKFKISYLKEVYTKNDITSIVLGEENILLDTFVFKKAISSQNVFTYPYTIPNPKEMIGGSHKSYELNSIQGRILKKMGGRWVRILGDKVFLLLPLSKIFSFLLIRYSPKNPWILNFDLADKILLESQNMAQLYRGLGFSSQQLEITGSLNDDLIAKIISQRQQRIVSLHHKYNLSPVKPVILVGFPPDQFPRVQAEFQSYDQLINTFVNTLNPYLNSFTILISKHPRITKSLNQMTEKGFIICDEPTIELVPLAHIYIASASATIRWAIASGIPVLNYDLYRYKYNDYASVCSVLNTESASEFSQKLHELLTNKNYFDELKSSAQKEVSAWGVLDGKSAERIVKLISR